MRSRDAQEEGLEVPVSDVISPELLDAGKTGGAGRAATDALVSVGPAGRGGTGCAIRARNLEGRQCARRAFAFLPERRF